MAKLLKLRRGTTSQHSSFTGAEGEVTIDTDKEVPVVHDGSTAGGHPVAAEDMANVSSASIAGRLATDSIATTKIAAGALPTDVTINSTNIANDSVMNVDVNASAAIAGTKISPDFGSQDVTTTGSVSGDEVNIAAAPPVINFNDSNHNPDYQLHVNAGVFSIKDATASADRITVTSSATTVTTNLDASDGVDVTGNITVSGTVDGRDVATDGTKLDGIEASATADQTNAEIRAAVEAASDSNVFTDDDHSKLNAIEASATADQSNAEIRTAVEAATDSNVFTDADHTKLNGIETSATADQTGAEVLALINSSDIYTSSKIGRDAGDYITFTTDTQMDVYVNGNNEFRFEADGDFHADGDVIAYSTTTASDRRLKENIEVVPKALDKVQLLNGVTFDWKRNGEKSAGVIAQEVLEVLPEAVKEVTPLGGGANYLTVNYHALISILIESIKELKTELEELKGGN